jgi:hypothetical protein
MFKASQMLVRPGVAQTQAVLARELSGGSGEASRLFRQAVTLTRDIERKRVEIGRLSGLAEPSPVDQASLADLQRQLAQAEVEQVATQAKLAEYPSYRVVSSAALTLEDLQKELRDGEAYYKMVETGDAGYAVFITPTVARAFKIGLNPKALSTEVDAIRDTITKVEDGQIQTFPFDAARAHKLYAQLFQPVSSEIGSVRHLIFEPDGAMLRLPANLLVMDQAGVAAYEARAKANEEAAFDLPASNGSAATATCRPRCRSGLSRRPQSGPLGCQAGLYRLSAKMRSRPEKCRRPRRCEACPRARPAVPGRWRNGRGRSTRRNCSRRPGSWAKAMRRS